MKTPPTFVGGYFLITERGNQMNADVTIQNENSIFIFNLGTDVVAQQFAEHLAEGMRDAGLEVE